MCEMSSQHTVDVTDMQLPDVGGQITMEYAAIDDKHFPSVLFSHSLGSFIFPSSPASDKVFKL